MGFFLFSLLFCFCVGQNEIILVDAAPQRVQNFIFDHDGGVDDMAALYVIAHHVNSTTSEDRLVAVTLTPGDCIIDVAKQNQDRLLSRFKVLQNVKTAVGLDEGSHPFPDAFRKDSELLAEKTDLSLPVTTLEDVEMLEPVAANELMSSTLMTVGQNVGPVAVISVGPLSTVAAALRYRPRVGKKKEWLRRVVWMGGAIDVPGNVAESPSAEWNVWADVAAAVEVFNVAQLDIWLVPLDVTQKVPLTEDFVERLESECGKTSLLSQIYRSTGQPFGVDGEGYHLWDVLTTLVALDPEKIVLRQEVTHLSIDPETGRTYRDPENGRPVNVVFDVNIDAVYQRVIDSCKTVQ